MCPDAEYYDFSKDQWRTWDGSWLGYCNYQASWFQWSPSEIFDLDTLSCISSWDNPKILITDSTNFNVDSFWRNLSFYIDPKTTELIELGTKTYPYRTIEPVFAEILKHYSYKDITINIYLKENTTLMFEESKSFIIDIKEVIFETYSLVNSSPAKATIISTDKNVEGISK